MESEKTMQRIDSLISELKMIMQANGISQTSIINALEGKCARNTVLSVLNGDRGKTDPRLSTLLMILDACAVELRMETDRSREAILSGDIAAYRTEIEQLRTELDHITKEKEYFQGRFDELVEKNTVLTKTVDKQQSHIERYMARMERAEDALYAANADSRRKDAKIVELLTREGKW